jgi:hypothetical protein
MLVEVLVALVVNDWLVVSSLEVAALVTEAVVVAVSFNVLPVSVLVAKLVAEVVTVLAWLWLEEVSVLKLVAELVTYNVYSPVIVFPMLVLV